MEQFYGIGFYIISILISVGVITMFYLTGEHTKLLRSFLVMLLMIIIWILGKILMLISPNETWSLFFTGIQYIGVCYFGNTFLSFSYFFQKGIKMNTLISSVLLLITSANYFGLITNGQHQLFFTEYTVFYKTYGPIFYFHTLYSYALIGTGYIYLLKGLYQNNNDLERNKKIIITIGLGLPLIANILHVFILTWISSDLTPIMFNITFIVFGYMSYRHKFLDIKKIARNTIFENMQEGIIITDSNLKILKVNTIIDGYAKKRLNVIEDVSIEKAIEEIKSDILNYADLVNQINILKDNSVNIKQLNLDISIARAKRAFVVQVEKIINNKNQVIYYIFRFVEVTKYKNAVAQLENKNNTLAGINRALAEELAVAKKLAISKERNRVSKELHDIIGHSLTIVISLLEMSKLIVRNDRLEAKAKVIHTREIVRDGFSELKKSLSGNLSSKINVYKLIEEIDKMGKEIETFGTHVEVVARHSGESIEPKCYDAIYRICQEGLTNAVRHGQAKNITVGIRFNESGLDLIIADDGKGCTGLTKGNGLLGMEQRVIELEGSLSCGSPDGEGFNLHIKLPKLTEELLCS